LPLQWYFITRSFSKLGRDGLTKKKQPSDFDDRLAQSILKTAAPKSAYFTSLWWGWTLSFGRFRLGGLLTSMVTRKLAVKQLYIVIESPILLRQNGSNPHSHSGSRISSNFGAREADQLARTTQLRNQMIRKLLSLSLGDSWYSLQNARVQMGVIYAINCRRWHRGWLGLKKGQFQFLELLNDFCWMNRSKIGPLHPIFCRWLGTVGVSAMRSTHVRSLSG